MPTPARPSPSSIVLARHPCPQIPQSNRSLVARHWQWPPKIGMDAKLERPQALAARSECAPWMEGRRSPRCMRSERAQPRLTRGEGKDSPNGHIVPEGTLQQSITPNDQIQRGPQSPHCALVLWLNDASVWVCPLLCTRTPPIGQHLHFGQLFDMLALAKFHMTFCFCTIQIN